ncbi:MAG: hypothetical protein C0407_03935 [Desulfobacca sp.]|nr:hypothetical protein [Desulfobacca sp.]
MPVFASIQRLALPIKAVPSEKGDLSFQSLLTRLSTLNEPISREGTGRLIARAPGEYFRLQFRLIARGPEALRMEIFDPFGRPMLYIVSYLGETRIFSMAQKKEIPFNQSLSGPWAAISQMPITELLKLLWGRVPLFPYESYQVKTGEEEGKESIKILFDGPVHQELWIIPHPFSITKSLIKNRAYEGELEITFSDFSSIAGSRIPLQCEIKEGTGDNALTIRYETLILRPDISEDTFKFPDLPSSQPSSKP